MTDEQLLEKIEKIVSKQTASFKKEKQELNEQLDLTNTKLVYLETVYRSLLRQFESLDKRQKRQEIGQEELMKEQLASSKTLEYIKTKLNKTAKTVDIIGLRYDERIVDKDRRIDRIENHLNLPPYKAKQ